MKAAFLVLVPFAFVACDAFGLEEGAVKARAASDLECGKRAVTAEEIGRTHSWRVSGCGHMATYTCIRGEGVGQDQYSCMKEGAVESYGDGGPPPLPDSGAGTFMR